MVYSKQPAKSEDGYRMPNPGERAVYWKRFNYTDTFKAEDFRPSEIQKEIDANDVEILMPY